MNIPNTRNTPGIAGVWIAALVGLSGCSGDDAGRAAIEQLVAEMNHRIEIITLNAKKTVSRDRAVRVLEEGLH